MFIMVIMAYYWLGRRKLFMVVERERELSKNVGRHGLLTIRSFKITLAKMSSPKKRNLDQKINDKNLIFGYYLLIRVDFLVENLKKNLHFN